MTDAARIVLEGASAAFTSLTLSAIGIGAWRWLVTSLSAWIVVVHPPHERPSA